MRSDSTIYNLRIRVEFCSICIISSSSSILLVIKRYLISSQFSMWREGSFIPHQQAAVKKTYVALNAGQKWDALRLQYFICSNKQL